MLYHNIPLRIPTTIERKLLSKSYRQNNVHFLVSDTITNHILNIVEFELFGWECDYEGCYPRFEDLIVGFDNNLVEIIDAVNKLIFTTSYLPAEKITKINSKPFCI
jgi:hypothetical protein